MSSTRKRPFAVLAGLFLATIAGSPSCRAVEPTNRPLDTCQAACEKRAKSQCSSAECERGCEFILDRIIEHEAHNVIACVARRARRCADVVWADCAASIGVHADGGPPAPSPPPQED